MSNKHHEDYYNDKYTNNGFVKDLPPAYNAVENTNVASEIPPKGAKETATEDDSISNVSAKETFSCGFATTFKELWAYRNTLIIILTPLVLLPIPIIINTEPSRAGYLLLWMATWWVTECVPIAVTSLLPVVILPLMGVMKPGQISINYMRETAMLFIGGLVVAIGIEKWNLHKRIAFRILLIVGSKPVWLMMGFMLVTWFLSMWISNTATTAMMLPVVSAVLDQLDPTKLDDEMDTEDEHESLEKNNHANNGSAGTEMKQLSASTTHSEVTLDHQQTEAEKAERAEQWKKEYQNLCKGMNICICYAANIGGTATLTGTTPNLIMQGSIGNLYEERGLKSPLSFATWMGFGLPGAAISVILCWLWLQIYFFGFKGSIFGLCCAKRTARGDRESEAVLKVLRREYEKLGPWSFAEVMILIHFVALALLWLLRDPQFIPGWASLFKEGYIKDSTPAVIITILLFIVPAKKPTFFCLRKPGERRGPVTALMDWETVEEKFPWGVLLLLGGGFALAESATVSGLSAWISEQLTGLKNLPPWAMVMIICFAVAMITQVTSNTAITTLMMPILSGLSINIGLHPMILMLSATIAASCAFMLPVATPPNAIVFAYGHVTVVDMVKAGFMMNCVCVLVITLGINTWGNAMFNLSVMPWNTTTPVANATMLYAPVSPIVDNQLWNQYIEQY
ncbi:unnamed protein product [Owenia fusiformis]|uniref:Uncharacterized protein n=1 Tax=Owenia fusiformis TaxID=6347 RepID=A0A8J1YBC1_OWEFU|nr:unnamed protein product [Owenia fusiformis]